VTYQGTDLYSNSPEGKKSHEKKSQRGEGNTPHFRRRRKKEIFSRKTWGWRIRKKEKKNISWVVLRITEKEGWPRAPRKS